MEIDFSRAPKSSDLRDLVVRRRSRCGFMGDDQETE